MKFAVKTGIAVLALIIAGGSVHGWATGWFFPCGPLDRYWNLSDCRVLAQWDNTRVQAVIADSDGLSVQAVLRQAADDTTVPQRLAGVDLAGGATGTELVLEDVPPAAYWLGAKTDSTGKLILAHFQEEGIWLLDRDTGKKLAGFEGMNTISGFAFSKDDKHVLVDQSFGSFERPVGQLAAQYGLDGKLAGDVTGAETWPVYSDGIGAALTPDGETLVQHARTPADSGVVALRLTDPAFADWAGSLLVANVGAWMSQLLPSIWISPDAQFVAASFDSADEWGQINSALVIWEIESQAVAIVVPSWRAKWENVVWLPEGRVAASRYNIDWHSSQIALIRYD